MSEATDQGKFRAICTEHGGGLWYGKCRDTYKAADTDAKKHGNATGHTEYDVESNVDPAECKEKPPELE